MRHGRTSARRQRVHAGRCADRSSRLHRRLDRHGQPPRADLPGAPTAVRVIVAAASIVGAALVTGAGRRAPGELPKIACVVNARTSTVNYRGAQAWSSSPLRAPRTRMSACSHSSKARLQGRHHRDPGRRHSTPRCLRRRAGIHRRLLPHRSARRVVGYVLSPSDQWPCGRPAPAQPRGLVRVRPGVPVAPAPRGESGGVRVVRRHGSGRLDHDEDRGGGHQGTALSEQCAPAVPDRERHQAWSASRQDRAVGACGDGGLLQPDHHHPALTESGPQCFPTASCDLPHNANANHCAIIG